MRSADFVGAELDRDELPRTLCFAVGHCRRLGTLYGCGFDHLKREMSPRRKGCSVVLTHGFYAQALYGLAYIALVPDDESCRDTGTDGTSRDPREGKGV